MSTVFSARRPADRLAEAIDDPRGRVPGLDPEISAMLDLVEALRVAPADEPSATPSADFSADLRDRLMNEAASELAPSSPLVLPPRQRGHRERRLVAAVTALIFVGGTAGMAAASAGALPGDPLYPIKRGLERAEAGLSVSSAGRGRDLLEQAQGRLSEIDRLVQSDPAVSEDRASDALADFEDQADEGADLLLAAFRDTRDADSISEIRHFSVTAMSRLEELAGAAPAELQGGLSDAAQTVRALDRRAWRACEDCRSGSPVLQLPHVFLIVEEADRALDRMLRDGGDRGLDNSHPFGAPGGDAAQ